MQTSSPFLRTADLVRSGLDDRRVRHRAERGELARIVAGTYVSAGSWSSLSDRERYVTRVRASVERLGRPVAISHWSAAAAHGFPCPDSWPTRTEVTDPLVSKTRSAATLIRRAGALGPGEVEAWEGLWRTTAVRTAADIALTEPFDHAVLVLDHGLRVGAFTRDEVRAAVAERPDARRTKTALAAVEFASEKAEYAGESFSRCAIIARGFVSPSLQEPFRDDRGLVGCADFWWESAGIVGEFDGDWKYTDPRWLRGTSPGEAIADEKRRQNRLEAHPRVRRVVRWDYAVARNPDELARRLVAAGVPRLAARNRRERAP